ncbi:hypothetical protein NFI96_024492 [Prochilodus magdalenae]|nr:hypothetical protein NFI96_024492 [Prochilodus magdalenae]
MDDGGGDKNEPVAANDKDVSSDKAELKSQAGIPQEPNLATQTDSSQSKDGAADKKEQRKE